MTTVPIVISDRIRLPKKYIPTKDIKKRYVIELYDESNCATCTNRPDRGPENEICQGCKSFMGVHRFYNSAEAKEGVWSLPQADLLGVKTYLRSKGLDFKIKDKRKEKKFKHDIKFTGKLFGKGDIDDEGFKRANQKFAIKQWMKHKTGIVVAKARSGKCLIGSSMVNTNKGFLYLDELVIEKGYHATEGRISSKNGIESISHTYRDKSSTRRITTEHGMNIEGTTEHPVYVLTPNLDFVWKELKDISIGDYLVTSTPKTQAVWPKTSNVSIEEARLLGYYLANGRQTNIHSNDPSIQASIQDCLKAVFGEIGTICSDEFKVDYIRFPRGGKAFLEKHGFTYTGNSATKRIPLTIRQSSREIMVEFLSSYFKCDSTKNGKEIELSSASETLIRQLHTILWQGFDIQGYIFSKKKQASNSRRPIERLYWFIRLPSDSIPLFESIFRAKALCPDISRGGHKQGYRYRSVPYMMEVYEHLIREHTISLPNRRLEVFDGQKSFFPNLWFTLQDVKHLASLSRMSALTKEVLSDIKRLDISLYHKFNEIKKGYTFSRVVSVKNYRKVQPVYDLTVPGSHSYFANGVVCHNTVLSTYSYCKLGVRTVIVANQRELLNQFYETATGKAPPKYLHGKFVDSDVKAGRKAMTNIAILEEETGQKIIFLPKNFAQLETFIKKHGPPDVLLVPYQSFMHDASRVHNVINKYYSMVIVDEEHGTGAAQYLAFIARLNLLYRMGLTATPHRKDGKSKLSARVMGPVVAQISGASIQPKIIFYPVKAKPTSKHKTWTGAEAWLKRSKDRNIEIVQQVFSDLRSGDNVIIIPVNHKDHQDALVKMINKQAEFNARERGENWPVKLARPFHADVDRQKTLAWVDSYDKKGRVSKKLPTNSPRVIVAIRSMIQQGIDMKRPSMVYLIIPMSGKYYVGAPMAYQLFCRVATPYRDKPEAKVKIFVDNVPFFAKCIQSLLFNEILPKSNLKKEKDFDYKLDSATYAQAKSLLNARSDSRSRKTVKWWE